MDILCNKAVPSRQFLWLVLACTIPIAIGAELNPYSLPSQQRIAPPQDTRALEQRAVHPAAISDSYYEQFAAQTKTLKPEQRSALQQSFAQKRDQAVRARRADQAQHYARLLEILGATK